MDFRESVAYSLVTHFVLFLALVTVSKLIGMPPAGSWVVDLVAEGQPEPRSQVEASPKEETKAESSPDEEAKESVAPEEEPVAEQPTEQITPKAEEKREEPVPPATPAEESELAKLYRQFLRAHASAYSEKASSSILTFVNSEIEKRNQWNLNGLSAQVRLYYDGYGAFREFEVLSDSDELKWILRYVSWQEVPLPASYFLKFKAVDVWITIKDNYIHTSLSAI